MKQIQVKHKEVKSTKSYRLMNIIAQYITEKCLTDILLPVKEVSDGFERRFFKNELWCNLNYYTGT